MNLCAYSNLKQHTLTSVGGSDRLLLAQILCTLKEVYKNDINSNRRLEQITTIGQLLHVLEIRDVMSENDVGPLKEISQRLPNNSELLRKIDLYERTHIRRELNDHAPEVIQNSYCRPQAETPPNYRFGTLSSTKKQKILDTIINEVGNSWRDLARSLKLTEPTIQNIENSCNTLPSKVAKILDLYSLEDSPHVINLCDALKKIRRKDLSLLLQEIMETKT